MLATLSPELATRCTLLFDDEEMERTSHMKRTDRPPSRWLEPHPSVVGAAVVVVVIVVGRIVDEGDYGNVDGAAAVMMLFLDANLVERFIPDLTACL